MSSAWPTWTSASPRALTTLRSGRPERLDYVALDDSREVVAASHASLLGPAPDWVQRALTASAPVPERLGPGPQHALAIRAPVPDPDGGTSLGWLVGRLDWRLVEESCRSCGATWPIGASRPR